MQKHPNSILVQYLLCQRDHAFHLTRQQERFEFATAVKPTFWFFVFFCLFVWDRILSIFVFLGEEKKMAKKIDSLRVTVHVMVIGGRGEPPPKHFFVFAGGIFGTSGHHCEPLDVLVPSFGTFLTVCPP